MLNEILFTLLALLSYNDADGLRRSAPTYLDVPQAAAHAASARVAGIVYDQDPDILLAIAYRESRYQTQTVTRESGGRVSCGVMTPTPTKRCYKQTVLEGYLTGAKHLREWSDACRGNYRCTQLGYAGGYALINLCKTSTIRQCRAPQVIRAWAARIQRSRLAQPST